MPYAELHCHTNFSFLDGASHPEELVAEAVRLGLHALAVTDHDGFYGVVRAADAARAHDLPTVVGAELSLGLPGPQQGVADPVGTHLLVLARGAAGYHRLAAAITEAQLRGEEKGRPVYDLEELAGRVAGPGAGDWLVLTGCRKGAVRTALATGGLPAAAAELDRLVALFGRDQVVVELFDHGHPTDSWANDAVAGLAARAGLPVVATGNVHVATPAGRRLAGALAAVRARRSLADMDGWLTAAGAAHLRSGAEMAARFARYPGAVARSVQLADELAFPLLAARPKLPRMEIPAGHSPMSWLRELCLRGSAERFGPPGSRPPATEREYGQRLERELAVIEAKDFPGYFLIVHDLVAVARQKGILCQGRGSAANSLVCYLLHITAVDPVFFGLPFERFLSTTRDEEPDIDVDFDSDRREEVIQHVYRTYGRRNAAQVANVITYRPKLAVRDVAKALGYSTGQQDAWSKQVEAWGSVATTDDHDIPPAVVELSGQLLGFPRHLGIHSGGMVLTDRPVGEVCPIEHARKDERTVLQWDKDDCAAMGLVKFDLLGLGMLAALQYCFDLVAEHTGERLTLDSVPKEEPGVYDMLCRADSIGVFQVESRAQMGTLAPAAAAGVLPPGHRDRADPPRPHPGRGGAPLHPAQAGPGAGQLPAPAAGAGAGAHAGRPAVPGAAHADRRRGRRVHRRRRRPAAPGDGLQARQGEDLLAAPDAVRRDGRARHPRRRGRGDLRQDRGVRELRVRREPLDQLRAAGLRLQLGQAAPPGGVPGRAAAGPADGLLLPADAGRRRPPARRAGAHPRHPPLRGARRPRAARHRDRRTRPGTPRAWTPSSRTPGSSTPPRPSTPTTTAGTARSPSGWGWPASGRSGWTWPPASWPSGTPPGRSPRWPTWPGGSGCRPRSWRRWPRPGCSTRWGCPAGRRCGRPAAPPGSARTGCRAPPATRRPRCCRA